MTKYITSSAKRQVDYLELSGLFSFLVLKLIRYLELEIEGQKLCVEGTII
jgi:hypothetical protein